MINVLAMVRQEPTDEPRTTDAPRGDAEAAFAGWEPAVAQLLQVRATCTFLVRELR